jgi:hypothetical protein
MDAALLAPMLTGGSNVGGIISTPPVVYLRVDWTDGTTSGSSFSPFFIMTTSNVDDMARLGFLSTLVPNSGQPAKSETKEQAGVPAPGSGTPSASSSSSAPVESSSTTGPGTPAESNGLSMGAIAGIAVGAGVGGLLIIGLLVWFFLRRRKSKRGGAGYAVGYSSDGHHDGNASGKWDKELPMVTSDSPQSRFAPADASRLRDQRSSMVGSGHHEDESASFAPYSDRDAAADRGLASTEPDASHSQADLNEGTTRTATPPAATSSRYAHLVEEGMTDDEIRRLEEEERALDAAIEDAGRNSRAA